MNRSLAVGVLLGSMAVCMAPGCKSDGGDEAPEPTPGAAAAEVPPAAVAGTQVQMDFTRAAGFYAAPFPSDERLKADGRPDMGGFPNPNAQDLPARVLAMIERDARGFGVTSGVFFSLTAAPDEARLPDLAGSLGPDARVFLVGIDPASPDHGRRYPVQVAFRADGGLYGAPNLLAVLPLQGIPLRPRAAYAAVVMRSLGDAAGDPLGVSLEMATIAAGKRPPSLSEPAHATYQKAAAALRDAGVDLAAVAGMAAFTTGDPTEGLAKVRADMLARQAPALSAPFAPAEVFDDYCVFRTTLPMPADQRGAPPFSKDGGEWVFDEAGKPVPQGSEEANFVVTVPRRPMPAAGYPIVLFSRTGGGGERPLVDRGAHATEHGEAITAGSGPARTFARAGFAGASVDGPHGGLRNITHDDEQFLMFNVGNPGALRDNVRQSAAELALVAHVLAAVSVDASSCPGAGPGGAPGQVNFDGGTMALMGHSMGATISPLTLAIEPMFRAGILSGAGGSWIANIIDKKKPLPVKGFAELLLGLANDPYKLHTHDPMLSMFQWAAEAADPPAYGRSIIAEPIEGAPRHVLMLQGIVDHYILPSIANATSLSFGLDLGGEPLDAATPELSSFTPLEQLLGFSGRARAALPAGANQKSAKGEAVTGIVVQHREDGIEDGHEVVFQTPAPKHQYQCFLEGLAKGMPRVPPPGAEDAPCE
jgi:hypothetical protein